MARCNYVPARFIAKYHTGYYMKDNQWSKIVARYGCHKLVPTNIVRQGARIAIWRNMCPKHVNIKEIIEPQMPKLTKLWQARRTDFHAKKPYCSGCWEAVKPGIDGLHLNKAWMHYKCIQHSLYIHHGLKQTCGVCGSEGACITFDMVPYCKGHANAYLLTHQWFQDMPQHVKAAWDNSTYPYGESDEPDVLDHSAELGPNPVSSTPNGWMPQQNLMLENLDIPCNLCGMDIDLAERKEVNGVLYHSDCAEALAHI